MYKRLFRSLLPLIALSGVSISAAQAQQLNDHDNGPLAGLFGFPDSTEGAVLVGKGRLQSDTVFSTASHSNIEVGGEEALFLDGETRRLEVNFRYGLSDRVEIGVELPYVWHESGSLDTLIDDWHSFFGLPDGFRPDQPIDSLQFFYSDAGVERLNLVDNSRGLGDIRLTGGWLLNETQTRRIALRAGLKFATGDTDTLLGSGGTDLSVGIAGDYSAWFGNPKLSAYFMASAIWLGEPDLLADRYEELVGHLAFGMGYDLFDRLELRAQAIARSAIYDSAVDNLGDSAMVLTVGGNIRLADRWRLSLAVAEDIKVSSAPDVTFQVGLHFQLPQ